MTKRLPDHSTHQNLSNDIFTTEQYTTIRANFPFDDDYDLETKLDDAAYWYKIFSSPISDPSIGDVRKNLESMKARTEKLQEVFEVLGQPEFNYLNYYIDGLDIHSFKDELHKWRSAAYSALQASKDYHPKKGGRANQEHLRAYIRNLYNIYKEGTGLNDKCSKGSKSEGFKIRDTIFIRFVTRIVEYMEIDITSHDRLKEIICESISKGGTPKK